MCHWMFSFSPFSQNASLLCYLVSSFWHVTAEPITQWDDSGFNVLTTVFSPLTWMYSRHHCILSLCCCCRGYTGSPLDRWGVCVCVCKPGCLCWSRPLGSLCLRRGLRPRRADLRVAMETTGVTSWILGPSRNTLQGRDLGSSSKREEG